jgi:hypothetical protein
MVKRKHKTCYYMAGVLCIYVYKKFLLRLYFVHLKQNIYLLLPVEIHFLELFLGFAVVEEIMRCLVV